MAVRRAQGSQSGKRVGRYTLQERLGGDRVHEAYVAQGESSSVRVRVLRPEVALNPAVVSRFVEAPRSLCGLSHPNLARTEGVETDDLGIPFVVEELCDGTTLKDLLKKDAAKLSPRRVAELLIPVCDALAHVHAHDVVHGRLDPECVVLVGKAGSEQPKITGFGRIHDAVGDSSTIRPATHHVAPEIAKGTEEPGVYSDVWSLGVLLYELLAGHAPGQLYARVQVGERLSKEPQLASAPAELRALVDACLLEDPHARLPSVTILRDRLRALVDKPSLAPVAEVAAARMEPPPPPDAADDDGPELEFEAAEPAPAPEPEPEPEPASIKGPNAMTLSAVAAAFASIEDAQGAREAEAASVKRAADREPARKKERAGADATRPARRKAAGAGLPAAFPEKELTEPRSATPGPAEPKRRDLAPGKAVDLETLQRLQRIGREDEREGRRWILLLLLLLFCPLLMFGVPYLIDPDPSRLEAVVGVKALKPGLIAMSVLGVGVMIGLWAMKVQATARLVRPLLWCSQLLAMCLGGVTASWLLPEQNMGAFGFMAHRGLPWFSAGFFLFLMLWAMAHGLTQLKSSALAGLGALVMSAIAAFGGYNVVRQAILAPMKAQLAARLEADEGEGDAADEKEAEAAAAGEDKPGDSILKKLSDAVGGGVDLSEEGKAIAAEGEGVGEVKNRTHAGESEAEDMQGVQALEDSRKATQRQVEMLKNVMPNAAK